MDYPMARTAEDVKTASSLNATPGNMSLITSYQVRIAVLENNLEHERAAKEAAHLSIQQLTRSFTSVIAGLSHGTTHQSTMELEGNNENKHLRRLLKQSLEENERLKARFGAATHARTGQLAQNFPRGASLLDTPFDSRKDGGRISLSETRVRLTGDQASNSPAENEFNISYDSAEFDSQLVLELHHSSSFESTGTRSRNGSSTPRQRVTDPILTKETKEIDFLDLDDVLGHDTKSNSNQVRKYRSPEIIEGFRGDPVRLDDLDITDTMDSASELEPLPDYGNRPMESLYTESSTIYEHAPAVLKAGLDARNSFNGGNYSSEAARRARGHGRHERLGDRSFDSKMYKSAAEEREALNRNVAMAGPSDVPRPDFFTYGLQYCPPQSETNFYRTVHIGNLPSGITLRQLLSRVRGGAVISATICNTVKITGSMSAMVVFLNTSSAAEYAEHSKIYPILFDSTPATITIIKTPTWPLCHAATRRIHEHHQTRCIAVADFRRSGVSTTILKRDLVCGNAYRADAIEDMWVDEDGNLHINFGSIYAAGSAYGILTRWREYKFLDVGFVLDPCARPLEDLLAPAGPKRGNLEESTPADVEELDYDDVPKVTVPQFGSPLSVAPVLGAVEKLSWADEMNGDYCEVQGAGTNTDMHCRRPPELEVTASTTLISPEQGHISKMPLESPRPCSKGSNHFDIQRATVDYAKTSASQSAISALSDSGSVKIAQSSSEDEFTPVTFNAAQLPRFVLQLEIIPESPRLKAAAEQNHHSLEAEPAIKCVQSNTDVGKSSAVIPKCETNSATRPVATDEIIGKVSSSALNSASLEKELEHLDKDPALEIPAPSMNVAVSTKHYPQSTSPLPTPPQSPGEQATVNPPTNSTSSSPATAVPTLTPTRNRNITLAANPVKPSDGLASSRYASLVVGSRSTDGRVGSNLDGNMQGQQGRPRPVLRSFYGGIDGTMHAAVLPDLTNGGLPNTSNSESKHDLPYRSHA